MTDDYWGPPPDEAERLREETARLRALLETRKRALLGADRDHLRTKRWLEEDRAENAWLRARVRKLEGVLHDVEWVPDAGMDSHSCPRCGYEEPEHAVWCQLDAVLNKGRRHDT